MKFHSFLENIHFLIFEFHSIQKNIHFLTRALYSIQNFIQFKENPCHSFKKTIHLFEKSFIEHPYSGVGQIFVDPSLVFFQKLWLKNSRLSNWYFSMIVFKDIFVANSGHCLLAEGWELWIRMFLSKQMYFVEGRYI